MPSFFRVGAGCRQTKPTGLGMKPPFFDIIQSGIRLNLIMKEWAKSFYKSQRWQKVRQAAISRDAYLCVDCMKRGIITPAEEVHHITELTPDNITDPNITLNLDNLVSLCRECHKARHGARQRRYKVDEFGRVEISPRSE